MHKINISDEVWDEIAKRGKFGETEDDVLRRVFGIEDKPGKATRSFASSRGRGKVRYATKRMSTRVEAGQLVVDFEDGVGNRWQLPDRQDKAGIRVIRDEAIKFALENGASDPGQTNAVRKALTDAGYHLTK